MIIKPNYPFFFFTSQMQQEKRLRMLIKHIGRNQTGHHQSLLHR